MNQGSPSGLSGQHGAHIGARLFQFSCNVGAFQRLNKPGLIIHTAYLDMMKTVLVYYTSLDCISQQDVIVFYLFTDFMLMLCLATETNNDCL